MSADRRYLFARLAAENDRTILEQSLVERGARIDAATRLIAEQEIEIANLRRRLEIAHDEIRRLGGTPRA